MDGSDPTSIARTQTTKERARILLVDDDADDRRLLGEQLHHLEAELTHAADGVQALSAALRDRPNLIILDLGLPAGDGFTVLSRLRRIPSVAFVPVIVLSGSQRPGVAEQALRLGAWEFVRKSHSGNDLIDAIVRVLGRISSGGSSRPTGHVDNGSPMPTLRSGRNTTGQDLRHASTSEPSAGENPGGRSPAAISSMLSGRSRRAGCS